MDGRDIRKYREGLEMSQNQLSVKSHLGQNTISQYESGKRMMDSVMAEHLQMHLRVVPLHQNMQLANNLVRHITEQVLEEDVLSYWAKNVRAVPENEGNDVLLNGGHLLVECIHEDASSIVSEGKLSMENLFLGFKQWLKRSTEYVGDQATFSDDGDIIHIDEIGINEICQYALFNDLLCDVQKNTHILDKTK